MKKLLKIIRDLVLNTLETTLICLAVFHNIVWVGNIIKAWAVVVFALGTFVLLISILATLVGSFEGVEKVNFHVKNRLGLPKWVHHLFDLVNALLLFAFGWWWTGGFLLTGNLLVKFSIMLYNNLGKKLKGEEKCG